MQHHAPLPFSRYEKWADPSLMYVEPGRCLLERGVFRVHEFFARYHVMTLPKTDQLRWS